MDFIEPLNQVFDTPCCVICFLDVFGSVTYIATVELFCICI